MVQHFAADTHEYDLFVRLTVLCLWVGIWFKSLENKVGLKILQNLIVAKVAVLRKVENSFVFLAVQLIIFVVEDLDDAFTDEVHLLDVTLVADNGFARRRDAAIHLDYHLVGEATLTLLKEVAELPLEFLENPSALDQVCLHLGSQLLVEGEILDEQVEVVE